MFIHLATEFIANELPTSLITDAEGNPRIPADAEMAEAGWYRFAVEPEPARAFGKSVRYERLTTGGDCTQVWAVESLPADKLASLQAQALVEKSNAIKFERDRRRFEGGVNVAGLWFKSDQQAVGEYTAMAMLGAAMPGTTVLRAAWRTMHPDTVTPMTPNLAKQILFAGFSSIAAIDDAALTHFSALQASGEPASYDFSAGWPAIYQESV